MSNPSAPQASITKYVGVLILGIMIPLIAAIMPWAMDRIFPANSLVFSFSGPIATEKFIALEFKISNNGTKVEQNIEARIPARLYKSTDYEVAKNGTMKSTEKSPDIIMESTNPSAKIAGEDQAIVVKIDSLKPTEDATIKLLIHNGRALIFEHEIKNSRVTSQDALGKYNGPSDIESYVYKAGTWLFILSFILLMAYSIYYEHFMPRAEKEKYLLAQIDKLK